MGSRTTSRILMGVVAVLVMASEALGQAPPAPAPRRSIEQITGGVYTRDEQQPPHGVPGHAGRHCSGGPDQR